MLRKTITLCALAAAALALRPAAAQISTGLALTTNDISTGHAGHSSLPGALGYWKAEGVDVSVIGTTSSATAIQLLVAGNTDFVSIDGEEVLLARQKGIPIKAVYLHARKSIIRLVAPKSSGITTIAQLKGKTLGRTSPRPSPFAVAAFREVGMEYEKDVKLLAIGVGAQALLALQRGDVDAYLSFDTAVTTLESRGMEFNYLKPSYFDDLFGLVIATREDVIEKKPELAVKVTRGIAKAVHFGLHNPDAAVKIHWKAYPQSKPQGTDEAAILATGKSIFLSRFDSYRLEGTDKYGESFPRQWQLVVDQMKAQGQLPADAKAEPAYTNDLIAQVNAWDRAAVAKQAAEWKE